MLNYLIMDSLKLLLTDLKSKYNAVSLRIDLAAEIFTDDDIKLLCDISEKIFDALTGLSHYEIALLVPNLY